MRQQLTDARRQSGGTGLQISVDEYKAFTSLIERRCGLSFSRFKKREFELKIGKLDQAIKNNIHDLIEAAEISDEVLQQIVNVLTVGESYFFRNRPHFSALSSSIIPEIIKDRMNEKSLNIWCAGCARGEEPYSVTMLLRDRFPLLTDWNISIIATDINTSFLAEARRGIYRNWSFRGVEKSTIKQYFHMDVDGDYRLHENIKRSVEFKHFNLIELLHGARPTGDNLDLIFCRNVLIYFPFNTADRIVKMFKKMIRPGGFLLVGHSEAFPELGGFEVIYSNATYYYRTSSDKERAELTSPAATTTTIPGIGVQTTYLPPPPEDTTSHPPATSQAPHISRISRMSRLPAAGQRGAPGEVKREDPVLQQARELADGGQTAQALEMLKNHAGKNGRLDHRVHFILALLADHSGDVSHAVESLKRAIFLNKNFIIGHYYLGVIFQREGEPNIAKRHFKNVLRLLELVSEDELLEESEGLNAGRLKEIVAGRYQEICLEQ